VTALPKGAIAWTPLLKPERRVRAPKPIRRTSRPRKARRTPLAALKRQLWRLFASYVKERDGNVCVSCGKPGLAGSGWHAGHLFPSNGNSLLRYHPLNVGSQCAVCNVWRGGNGASYANAFLDRYGVEQFKALCAMVGQPHTWTAPEVAEMIAELKRGGADYECWYFRRYARECLPRREAP
jgi:hypothetical protein